MFADTPPRFSFDTASAAAGMLTALLDQSNDCIMVISVDGSLDYINRNGLKVLEIDQFADMQGKPWWEGWPEDSRPIVQNAIKVAREGESTAFEARCSTAKGAMRWWDVAVSPLRDDSGKVVAIIAVSRDISDHVQAREATEALAQEMGHRLRNAYTLSSALARTLARGDAALESFAEQFGERLMHLGMAQNLVMDGVTASGTDVGALIERLITLYQGKEGSIELVPLPRATLTEKQAQALALAMHELATNSYKYGALSQGRTVTISSCDRDGRTVLCWNEPTTRPAPEVGEESGQHSGGQGRLLVQRFLMAVGGDIEFDWQPEELQVSIILPPQG